MASLLSLWQVTVLCLCCVRVDSSFLKKSLDYGLFGMVWVTSGGPFQPHCSKISDSTLGLTQAPIITHHTQAQLPTGSDRLMPTMGLSPCQDIWDQQLHPAWTECFSERPTPAHAGVLREQSWVGESGLVGPAACSAVWDFPQRPGRGMKRDGGLC